MTGSISLAFDARALPRTTEGRIVAIGNFDGVHVGHRRVLARATEHAPGPSTHRPRLCVLTFEPHPAAVVGLAAPARLTRLTRKVELLGVCGVELVVAQSFDAAFAALSPEAFVDEILVGGLDARRVVVGHDFRFGARRAGNLALLRTLGASRGFEVEVQEVIADARGPLSSTRVRAALAAGDLDDVRAVLGRPHALEGVVVEGDRRGRTIGFPTANLGEVEEALPALGVYAVVVDASKKGASMAALARGVANVGVRPTVSGDGRPSIEVHLFALSAEQADLYGVTLRVHFVQRIRDERRFESLEALRRQIADDAARATAMTSTLAAPETGTWW